MFDGPELEIKIKPHGNSKQDRPFFRTSATTKEHLKKVASENPPKQAIDILTKEQGGELEPMEQLIFQRIPIHYIASCLNAN